MADKNFLPGDQINGSVYDDWYERINILRRAVSAKAYTVSPAQGSIISLMSTLFSSMSDTRQKIVAFQNLTNKTVGTIGESVPGTKDNTISANDAIALETDLSKLEGSCISHCPGNYASRSYKSTTSQSYTPNDVVVWGSNELVCSVDNSSVCTSDKGSHEGTPIVSYSSQQEVTTTSYGSFRVDPIFSFSSNNTHHTTKTSQHVTVTGPGGTTGCPGNAPACGVHCSKVFSTVYTNNNSKHTGKITGFSNKHCSGNEVTTTSYSGNTPVVTGYSGHDFTPKYEASYSPNRLQHTEKEESFSVTTVSCSFNFTNNRCSSNTVTFFTHHNPYKVGGVQISYGL